MRIPCYVHQILSRFVDIHICVTVIIVCNNISLCKQNDLPSTGNCHLNKCVTLRQNMTCVCWRMFVEYFITYLVEFLCCFSGLSRPCSFYSFPYLYGFFFDVYYHCGIKCFAFNAVLFAAF